eukprot:188324_1
MSTLIRFLLCVVATVTAEMNLILLPNSTNAHCLDGSMAGFYYEAPETKSGDTLWTIFLQGGGACYSKESCTQRANSSLGSSNFWSKTKNGVSMYSTNVVENPDFYDGNHVFIPYCGGDLHSGTRSTNKDPETWGFYFQGHLIIESIIQYLINNYKLGQAQNVLLSGCSAGAIGTFGNVDWISRKLATVSQTITLKAAPVAGWFYAGNCTDEQSEQWDWAAPNDYPHWLTNTIGGAGHTNGTVGLWQQYLDPECTSKEEISWHCDTVHVAYKYIKTPILVLENRYDSQQLNGEMDIPSNVTDETKQYVEYFGYNMLLSMVNQVESPNGLFLPSCYDHCTGLTYGNFGGGSTTKITYGNIGYNVTEVLGDWFWERNKIPHILVDNCNSNLPCNPTCHGYGM